MKIRLVTLLLILGAISAATQAQSPTPVIVQAIVPAQPTTATAATPASAPIVDSSAALVKALQEIKAQNEDILTKQAAALQQLDEIEKNAEQLRIYNKRG